MTGRGLKAESRNQWSSVILSCSFLVGGLLGVLFAAELGDDTAGAMSEYLSDYLRLLERGEVPRSALRIFWSHGRWVFLCAATGLSALGIVLLPAFLFFRGFLLSFAIGCFICLFGRAGIVPSVVFFGISALLWAPALYLMADAAMECSMRRVVLKRENIQQVAVLGQRFYKSFLFSIVMLIVCVCFECRIVPALLPAVAEMIH